ncbi:hypothetical protein EVJ58_g3588 [Rhodofomes roseus]|uniref:Inositol polyphosphate-related phosphatase domain-containing protein n=1 Tax=Rhodofomes roseus TaxID=34475 RepID=A0A4Y9YMD1_9APHY|nr:hypothetical protein EVJ58_g3588 [Rhodofomes roseus]
MSDRLKLVVQGLLRPSEIVNAATEAYIISTQDGTLDNIPRARSDLPHGRKRVVAVVTHFEPQDGDRGQGCVIVIKMAQGPPSSKHEYSFERAIPITDGFSMSMAQMPSNTVQATGLPSFIRAAGSTNAPEARAHSALPGQRSIRVGTFNVNGKMPTQDLSSWLCDDRIYEQFIPPLKEISPLSLSDLAQSPLNTDTSNDARASIAAGVDDKTRVAEDQGDPDLFVLAFQELDLSAEALLYSTKTVREDAWCAAVFAGLGEKAVLYEKLVSKQLVGMLLLVIVRKRLRESFSDIRSASVGAGIMGMMGNKGATAVRMAYAPTSSEEAASTRPSTLTFVNSHLAAFDEMVDRRNADFHDICKRLLFDTGMTGQEPLAPDDVSSESNPITLNIFETDVLFWMVDFHESLLKRAADIWTLPREVSV